MKMAKSAKLCIASPDYGDKEVSRASCRLLYTAQSMNVNEVSRAATEDSQPRQSLNWWRIKLKAESGDSKQRPLTIMSMAKEIRQFTLIWKRAYLL